MGDLKDVAGVRWRNGMVVVVVVLIGWSDGLELAAAAERGARSSLMGPYILTGGGVLFSMRGTGPREGDRGDMVESLELT
jgi:hypothetical protein